MTYFPPLKSDVFDFQVFEEKVRSNIKSTLDQSIVDFGESALRILNGHISPELYLPYRKYDTLEASEAILMFNGLAPTDSALTKLNVSGDNWSQRLQNYYNEEKLLRANNWELVEKGIIFGFKELKRLDGLSTWMLCDIARTLKIGSVKIEMKKLRYIKHSMVSALESALIDDLGDRINTVLEQAEVWNSGNHPQKPSFEYVVKWSKEKGYKSSWLHYIDELKQAENNQMAENHSNDSEYVFIDQGTKMKNRARAFKHYLKKNKIDESLPPKIGLIDYWRKLTDQGYEDDQGRNLFQPIGNDTVYDFFENYTQISATTGPKPKP